jgi:hypothetical protein
MSSKHSNNHADIQTTDASVLKTLDEFVKDHKLDRKEQTTFVFSKDIDELKANNGSVELLLNYLAKNYGSLFYGSVISVNGNGNANNYLLRPNEHGIICCTNLGAAAIINSLVNKSKLSPPGMKIPCKIDSDNPFKVELYGLNRSSINEEGFVYVVNNTEGFEKIIPSSWQFMKRTNEPVHIAAKIPISKCDFKYSIQDVTRDITIKINAEFGRRY